MIWYMSIDEIRDSALVWDFLFGCILTDGAEQDYIKRYVFVEDRKRAALSLLLQHAVLRSHCPGERYRIKRTREGKPYGVYESKLVSPIHYNVSHHGRFVCIGFCDSLHTIGVDLVSIGGMPRGVSSITEYLSMFEEYFTSREMVLIRSGCDDVDVLRRFYINWALKEAIVKAMGCGLASCKLNEIHFDINETKYCEGSASIECSQLKREEWSFVYFLLDETHVVSICLGPQNTETIHNLRLKRTATPRLTIDRVGRLNEHPSDTVAASASCTMVADRGKIETDTEIRIAVKSKILGDIIPDEMLLQWNCLLASLP